MKYTQKLRHKQKQKGFTLVELLVIAVIIGILSLITMPLLQGNSMKARDARRVNNIKTLKRYVELYQVQHNELPELITDGPNCWGWLQFNANSSSSIDFGTGIDYIITEDFEQDISEEYVQNCEFGYFMYRYSGNYWAGRNGCPANKGEILVIGTQLEQMVKGKTREELGYEDYTFSCDGGRDWGQAGDVFEHGIVFGFFDNP